MRLFVAIPLSEEMRIKLQKWYMPDRFPVKKLKKEYGIYAVQGPRGILHSLSEALKK